MKLTCYLSLSFAAAAVLAAPATKRSSDGSSSVEAIEARSVAFAISKLRAVDILPAGLVTRQGLFAFFSICRNHKVNSVITS
jgi:hypothetical protein